MRFKTQDPKYDITVNVNTDGQITDAFLINAGTGIGIPVDEPLFIFRAKDKLAAATINYYADSLQSETFIAIVKSRVVDFINFAKNYPKRMKNPD
jgi:hypothetical protein